MKSYNEFINKKVISINENVNTDDLSNLSQEELNSKLEDYLKENDIDNIISSLNHGAHLKINAVEINYFVIDNVNSILHEEEIEENNKDYNEQYTDLYDRELKSLICRIIFGDNNPDNLLDIIESMEVKEVGQKHNFFLYQVKINEKPIFY